MKSSTILTTGIIGSVVAALCCFTPILVILLGAVGLSAWLGWTDFVLLPALAIFVAMTVHGLRARRRAAACRATDAPRDTETV